VIFAVGLGVTLAFRYGRLHLSGAPVIGIAAASAVAAVFGVDASARPSFSKEMFSAVGRLEFAPLFADSRLLLAVLIFFIIDFFGGVGKYIGLFAAMGRGADAIPEKSLGRALYVDGLGNVIGGVLGASSLAVFVSSAVGIVAGGRTGLTSVVTAAFMLASVVALPLLGGIPVQATSGVLVFVGFLLIPWSQLRANQGTFARLDVSIAAAAALLAFFTYGIDKAMLLVFLAYSIVVIRKGEAKRQVLLLAVTALLFAAVIAQS
jgi:AGZA family xanthine/uracil permease-like MFS transporter